MRLFALVVVFGALLGDAVLAVERIGSFVIFDTNNDVILLDGPIEIGTPLDFRRARQAKPKAQVLVLNSPGGLVASGLILADDVLREGMSTVIPSGLGCYSACSFVFFAGGERQVEGELGVHQMWAERADQSRLQITLSDVVDAFERFGVPTEVLTRMLRTDSADMYVYRREEADRLGINRAGQLLPRISGLADVARSAEWRPSQAPSGPASADVAVSSLRLAIYGGLDFYGSDIAQSREEDVVACAAACLTNAACYNFTFNANPSLTQGPNCFLKEGFTRLEIYGDALSGLLLLDSSDAAPTYRVSGIDPTADVSTGFQLLGRTLTVQHNARTQAACRIGCIENEQCAGYNYLRSTQQCTFLSHTDRAVPHAGAISGTKRWHVFEPINVLDLDE